MKTRQLLLATVLTIGFSATANAAPTGLDSFLSRVVSSALEATVEELKNEVTETVLNASHHIDTEVTQTSVEITDIPSTSVDKD